MTNLRPSTASAPDTARTRPSTRTTMDVTPLWTVMLFTFLNSIGSAVVYAGIFFLAESRYGFTKTDNFILALLYGLTYIPAALAVGPLLRRLARVGMPARHVLVFIMLSMAALSWLPWVVSRFEDPGTIARWPIWIAVGLYSPLSGALWPIVESFLAGGRSEHQLRSATGKFNICWSGALVVTLLAIGPLVKEDALLVLQSLGLVHVCCAVVLFKFAPAPGRHAHHHAANHPRSYKQLLEVLRISLPTAFLFISALSPYMPSALTALGVAAAWQTAVASIWYASRVLTFFAMERWHGWHGTWSTPIGGMIVLGGSFAAVVLSPTLGQAHGGLILLVAGLLGFGVGVGIIYAAALYYAMEVGSDGVDAGGMHETLIGIGYSLGPLCGLLAAGGVRQGVIPESRFEVAMLGLVGLLAVLAGLVAAWRAHGHAKGSTAGSPDP